MPLLFLLLLRLKNFVDFFSFLDAMLRKGLLLREVSQRGGGARLQGDGEADCHLHHVQHQAVPPQEVPQVPHRIWRGRTFLRRYRPCYY